MGQELWVRVHHRLETAQYLIWVPSWRLLSSQRMFFE
jgi:hypothetical protein